MIRIYRADTALLPDEEAVLRNMVFLDEGRKRKVWQCKNLEDKKRSLLAGYLIREGAKEWRTKEGGLQGDAKPLFLSYVYSEYGKPYLRGEKNLYFNISHSKNYVVCAFSDREVGIDIQVHKKGKGDIAQRFFSMEDRALMEKLAGVCPEDARAYLLTGSSEIYLEPRTLENRFRKYAMGCELPQVHFHMCRHSFATRCLEKGVDIKTLSEILGHSSVKITLDRYAHSSFDLKLTNVYKLTFLG